MAIWLRAREKFADNRFQLLFIYIYIYIYKYRGISNRTRLLASLRSLRSRRSANDDAAFGTPKEFVHCCSLAVMLFMKSVGLSFNCSFCRSFVYEDTSNSFKTSNVSKKDSDHNDQQKARSLSLPLTVRTVKVRRYVLARLITSGLCLVGLSCLLGT